MLPIEELRKLGMSEKKARAYQDALGEAQARFGAKVAGNLPRKDQTA